MFQIRTNVNVANIMLLGTNLSWVRTHELSGLCFTVMRDGRGANDVRCKTCTGDKDDKVYRLFRGLSQQKAKPA